MNPAAIPATIAVIAVLGFFGYVLVDALVEKIRNRSRR